MAKRTQKKKKGSRGWVEVSAGDIHDFEKDGVELTGKFFSQETIDSIPNQKPSQLYQMQMENGTIKKFWGSTILDSLMSRIKESVPIRIVFEGRTKGTGKKQGAKLFKVYVQSKKSLIPF